MANSHLETHQGEGSMPPTQAMPTFEMTVDLNVLEHLGINLYSNIAAVYNDQISSL